MKPPPTHQVALRHTPLPGVHSVEIHSERTFGRHWHDSHGFGVMDQGGHRSTSGRGQVEAVAGNIVTVNPGEVHDGTPLAGTSRRWRMIHITPDALGALLEKSPPEFTRPVFEDHALRASIDRVFRCWAGLPAENGSRDHGLWEEALTQACGQLVQCHSRFSAVQASQEPWRRVRECLLDQLDSPPSLNALAELSGMSRFQVVRQFSRAHGLPPFAWLLQHRLRQAKTLIGDGTPISEAAAACGFADQSHLNRHFAQCFGFTPGQWRQSCRGSLQ